jgi:hypothetical protein
VGHELERALVVVFEALGVDRDLVAAEVAGGFAGEVDVLYAFVHRNVELAGGGQVRDGVREDLAVVAGGRLAFAWPRARSIARSPLVESIEGMLVCRFVGDRDWIACARVCLGGFVSGCGVGIVRVLYGRMALVWRCGRQVARQG